MARDPLRWRVMTRHFLRDDDLSPAQQAEVLDLAMRFKAAPYDAKPLAGPQTVAMIFDKQTLRTQASFAAGIAELGGHPMLVDGSLAGIGKRESVADVESEEHTSELHHMSISYAVFCLKKKNKIHTDRWYTLHTTLCCTSHITSTADH